MHSTGLRKTKRRQFIGRYRSAILTGVLPPKVLAKGEIIGPEDILLIVIAIDSVSATPAASG